MKNGFIVYVDVTNLSKDKAQKKIKDTMDKFKDEDNIEEYLFIPEKNGVPDFRIEQYFIDDNRNIIKVKGEADAKMIAGMLALNNYVVSMDTILNDRLTSFGNDIAVDHFEITFAKELSDVEE